MSVRVRAGSRIEPAGTTFNAHRIRIGAYNKFSGEVVVRVRPTGLVVLHVVNPKRLLLQVVTPKRSCVKLKSEKLLLLYLTATQLHRPTTRLRGQRSELMFLTELLPLNVVHDCRLNRNRRKAFHLSRIPHLTRRASPVTVRRYQDLPTMGGDTLSIRLNELKSNKVQRILKKKKGTQLL